jgi:hypothetical protein
MFLIVFLLEPHLYIFLRTIALDYGARNFVPDL